MTFTDTNGRHAVEVATTTLYEAATLGMPEFRLCGFTVEAAAGVIGGAITFNTQRKALSPLRQNHLLFNRRTPGCYFLFLFRKKAGISTAHIGAADNSVHSAREGG
jgi:hypothetical protein